MTTMPCSSLHACRPELFPGTSPAGSRTPHRRSIDRPIDHRGPAMHTAPTHLTPAQNAAHARTHAPLAVFASCHEDRARHRLFTNAYAAICMPGWLGDRWRYSAIRAQMPCIQGRAAAGGAASPGPVGPSIGIAGQARAQCRASVYCTGGKRAGPARDIAVPRSRCESCMHAMGPCSSRYPGLAGWLLLWSDGV
uniref:Uncharacterized protein n=1 Tax=Oryza sativa subsp. japonica TaxID=39947 RepID=Q6EU18_ORYSJ|nr:hypothetical protein [Oryza sativa Japonica Group]